MRTDLNGMRWPSPAKINRFLHILGRRADGYHDLQTLFQFVSLEDSLWFDIDTTGDIRLASDIPGVASEQNLVLKAAHLLKAELDRPELGAFIRLHKKIPMGAGLGGGSSNAATVLQALNALWQAGLSQDQLETLGLQLGADVPVFIRGEAVFAEGVGEKMHAFPADEWMACLLYPGLSVPTGEIFSDPRLTRDSRAIKMCDLLAADWKNDCEATVLRRYPDVQLARNWMAEFGQPKMTGTGSCLFMKAGSIAEQESCLSPPNDRWQSFLVQVLNQSALKKFMACSV